MLFKDVSDMNRLAVAVLKRHSENLFGFEDAIAVVPQCPMTEISEALLRVIHPLVQVQVVVGLSSEQPG